jgi:FixJ family two-component response regulator
VIDPEVVAQLASRRRTLDPMQQLSERERQMLALMAEGRSNQAIGERLYLSPKTPHPPYSNSERDKPVIKDEEVMARMHRAYLRLKPR